MRRRVPLALAALAFGVLGAAAPATPAHAAVVTVHNNNINRWLVVIAGNGYRHDIAPRAKVTVTGGSESRKVWVVAGCRLEKDGAIWASSPPSGGHYKNFGWQPTEVDFFHFCP